MEGLAGPFNQLILIHVLSSTGSDQCYAFRGYRQSLQRDALSLAQAALLDQGLVMFPTWLIADELESGTLVALLEAWRCEVMPGRRDIHVVHRSC